jgi:outer membrane protein
LKIVLFLLLCVALATASTSSLRGFGGVATDYDFGEILFGKIGKFQKNSTLYGIDGGYALHKSSQTLPFDFYLKSGLSSFEQSPSQDRVYEVTLYIKAYYNIDVLDNTVRFGFGEGGSYTSAVLEVEREDALAHNDNNSHFLNYLDVSLDVDFGKLFGLDAWQELYVGVGIKHRSGIFGLINNVRHGGSNHVGFYLEKNF